MSAQEALQFSSKPSPEGEAKDTAGMPVDVLVLTALQDELEAVLALRKDGGDGWTMEHDKKGFRRYRLRRHERTTLGVEMEGVGIGEVADSFEKRAIVIKAVSTRITRRTTASAGSPAGPRPRCCWRS